MRLSTLTAGLAGFLAACTPVDPDTVRTKDNTFTMGDSEVTTVRASADRPLSPPTYLPEWAPVYPGAKLDSKTVQRTGGGIVGRGTTYSTRDPFAEVVRFYDSYYRDREITPTQSFTARFGRLYTFDIANGYQSLVNIQNLGSSESGRIVNVTIAQTASR